MSPEIRHRRIAGLPPPGNERSGVAEENRGHRLYDRFCRIGIGGIMVGVVSACAVYQPPLQISHSELLLAGERIFYNECAADPGQILSWNQAEEFLSLGIGHFIWYPQGSTNSFTSSFPEFIEFLQRRDVALPVWLIGDPVPACPWPNREAFLAARDSSRVRQLRKLMLQTREFQTEFISQRLQASVAAMFVRATPEQRRHLDIQLRRLLNTTTGLYPLLDYVNFKGEGLMPNEQYGGHRWGLQQVLEGMQGTRTGRAAIEDFVRVARALLAERVRRSPPERGESRWLPGWNNRLQTYLDVYDSARSRDGSRSARVGS